MYLYDLLVVLQFIKASKLAESQSSVGAYSPQQDTDNVETILNLSKVCPSTAVNAEFKAYSQPLCYQLFKIFNLD